MSASTQTVLVALITALAGASGALLGGWVQAHSSESDRFAAWQMHKRSVYADLLGSLRADGAESGSVTRREILRHISQAQIVANKELRERLHELAEDPQQLHDANALRAFVEQIHADVRKEGEPT
jgi:hypothetical protein